MQNKSKNFKALIIAIFLVFSMATSAFASMPVQSTTPTVTDGDVDPNIVIHEPPANWNALNATDEELAYYFYPSRPTDTEQLKDWKKAVSGKWIKPKLVKSAKKLRETPRVNVSTTSSEVIGSKICGSYNWSGVTRTGYTANRVTAFWYQPWANADTTHRPAYSYQFIGLGGVSGSPQEPLVQMGTQSDIFVDSSGDYEPFYETDGMPGHSDGSFVIKKSDGTPFPGAPGDTFYGDLSFYPASTGSSNGYATFYFSDSSKNTTTSFSLVNLSYSHYLNSSEWIVERPYVGTYDINLTNFGYVNFVQCNWATLGGGTTNILSSTNSTSLTMKSFHTTNNLAYPSAINSTTGQFNVTWQNYN